MSTSHLLCSVTVPVQYSTLTLQPILCMSKKVKKNKANLARIMQFTNSHTVYHMMDKCI